MNINTISSISLKANPVRRLKPLTEHKGPMLDLMFYEKDEINILKKQIAELEQQARDIIHTMNINFRMTGYQKDKCKLKLTYIDKDIKKLQQKIRDIKINRYNIQKAAFNEK